MTPNETPCQFVIAPTSPISEGGDTVVPFIAVQLQRVLAQHARARQALAAMPDTQLPVVSIHMGSGDALSEHSLEQLGIQPPTSAILVELAPAAVRRSIDGHHWSDAQFVRVCYHGDGEVWLHVQPKYGDAYEADLTAAIKAAPAS